jgi:hypothetical protein
MREDRATHSTTEMNQRSFASAEYCDEEEAHAPREVSGRHGARRAVVSFDRRD